MGVVMAQVGDRVQIPSKKVGQQPRDGVVTGASGVLLRVRWSTGEESTITPAVGSLVVVGRVRSVSKSATRGRGGPKAAGAKKVAKTAKVTTKGSKAVKASRKAGAAGAKRRK
jgi:hypothetical protein